MRVRKIVRWKSRDGVIEGDRKNERNDCHYRSSSKVFLGRVLERKTTITPRWAYLGHTYRVTISHTLGEIKR